MTDVVYAYSPEFWVEIIDRLVSFVIVRKAGDKGERKVRRRPIVVPDFDRNATPCLYFLFLKQGTEQRRQRAVF